MVMHVIVVNKNSFQTIDWINIKNISIVGTNWIVTNTANVDGTYAVDDYNVYIIGTEAT